VQTQPDVAILDYSMPRMNGIAAARMIRTECPDLPIVLLTTVAEEYLIAEAFKAGIRGYVLKRDAGDDLVRAIDAVREGATLLSPRAARAFLRTIFAGGGITPTRLSGAAARRGAHGRSAASVALNAAACALALTRRARAPLALVKSELPGDLLQRHVGAVVEPERARLDRNRASLAHQPSGRASPRAAPRPTRPRRSRQPAAGPGEIAVADLARPHGAGPQVVVAAVARDRDTARS
jgi:CheY-like chemotaxis protein